tara:strand:+ start:232 stop:777 length:546 start_codon:yes stop_codon:yes gene_type:complete
MEGIKSLLIYIGVHGLGLIIGFAIVGILITLKEHVNKINSLIRIMLLPVVMLLALISVAAVSNNLIAILAIFWSQSDIGLNIWLHSNIILPAATSYFLLWNVYFISPFFQAYVTSFIGILWIAFYVFMLYTSLNYGIVSEGGYLFELFDVETGFYGTMALIISSIGGAVAAIIQSHDGELE